LHPSRDDVLRLAAPFAADTVGLGSRRAGGGVRLRDLCAPIGDFEEAASGTTSAAIAHLLARHGAGKAAQPART
jgi:predicted PhzF superfamily epimerase YddE/YHI9